VRLLGQQSSWYGAQRARLSAANNRVSQSVPHFHVHIVPRTKGDGLKGFFCRPANKDAEENEFRD